MWIVELALKKGHTFVVLAIAIAMFGIISIIKMPTDIFPVINTPIVSCIWTYQGMSPYFMENLVTTVTERALTSTINGIDRMESSSLSGMSIIKVYLRKGTPIGEAVAMVSSVGTAILRQLPRGISPPFVTQSSATDVPVMQLSLSSDTIPEEKLFDIANNLIRTQLATVQGAITPFPYGGKYRQVMIDLNPIAMRSQALSAYDIMQAVNDQSIVAPTGTAKLGQYEYTVVLNNMPDQIKKLNNLPIKTSLTSNQTSAVVLLKDVANVHDGYQPQLNVVNVDGKRSVLLNILKSGDASTLKVVQGVKDILPRLKAMVPPACHIDVVIDQSLFVKECVAEVIREALTAALLTALMMLALLGSWRSTLIVATSIPLAILAAIIGLAVTGQTINSMTLGGLALAVGMLVDDATVEVENVHRNMAMGKDVETAILDGARQVALPALVSTLSICIVFVPLVFLTEPSRSLFVPLGLSVTFAMLASYGLSRTIVPLMSKTLLGHEHSHSDGTAPVKAPSIASKIFGAIDGAFEFARRTYRGALDYVLTYPIIAVSCFLVLYTGLLSMIPLIGEDYFPEIDGGQLRLHVATHAGTRVELTEKLFKQVEKSIRALIPADEIASISDNMGLPCSGINYAYSDSQTVSEADGEIIVSLKEDRKHDTAYYQKQIRAMMKRDYPALGAYFQPGDIVTQILNAGLPAPIDVKVVGLNKQKNYEIAKTLKRKIEKVRGAVDVCLHQITDAPHIAFTVDRTKAQEAGITQADVSNSFLINLSSSFQTNPNFWVNKKTGVSYNLAAQTAQRDLSNMNEILNTEITSGTKGINPDVSGSQAPDSGIKMGNSPERGQLLLNLATFERLRTPLVINYINVQPVYDIYAACQDRDLGGVSGDIKAILDEARKTAPHGTRIAMAGQVLSMNLAFIALLAGLVFALLLVYLLLVVNFQSWSDPLIILMAIPGALSGIVLGLFVTQTSFSIPALMGTIMTMGVASANSILMVTFARSQIEELGDARQAALNAGYERFRPVIMTATAMIIGMIPMAIGGGEGSQNAPIGRAVIGGLSIATLSTLFFVPLVFYLIRRKQHKEVRHVDS
ncbi:MAG: efflux RND transporter permease subunit [Candidatus Obscuribacter sp.]|nr:efflux RND transporter permease subunit [Candidatus Obscuribacter sp.]